MRAAWLVRRAVIAASVAAVLLADGDASAQDDRPRVLLAEVSGVITPVISDYLIETVDRAERQRHDAILVTLDTPGGLESSMREIVRAFLNSRVPVIVWVAPSGAQAASAGAVITLAAHVAAMSPGTNIGAATPVTVEGAEVGDKIVNNATSYIAAIAEERGRNVDVAREMVEKGRSEPASRAFRLGVVDLLADDRETLLRAIDGREFRLDERDTVTLRTRDATFVEHGMGWLRNVRQRLADPNLAFLFLSLGTLAIIYELANPGIGFGGIVGVILVVLGFFALAVLPVNVAGVALLLFAAGLFMAELFVPGIGVLAGGGAVSLALAGLFLVRGSPRVDLVVILPTVAAITAGVVFAGRLAWRARRAQPTWGAESLQGRRATVKRADGSTGQVLLEGAWWTVRSDEPLEVGVEVLVTDVKGLELVVERAERGQG